jgi:hypothetical protein
MIDTKQFKIDFRALVLGDAGVAALLGSKLYAVIAPQRAVMPFGVYRLVGTGDIVTHGGLSGAFEKTVELLFWSESQDDNDDIADALHSAIAALGQTVQGATEFLLILAEDEDEGFDPDEADGEGAIFWKRLAYRVRARADV